MDEDIDRKIPDGMVLVGVWSEHQNHHEDRRWKLTQCHFQCGAEATYEYLGVEWDTRGLSQGMGNPIAVAHGSYPNHGNVEITDTITLKTEITEKSTTTWEHHLGVGLSTSWSASFLFGDVSASLSLTYDYTQGKESSLTKTKTVQRSIGIKIPAHSHIEAKMILKQSEEMTIPFKVTFKKTTTDGKTSVVEEKGIWKGVLYYDIKVETKDIKD